MNPLRKLTGLLLVFVLLSACTPGTPVVPETGFTLEPATETSSLPQTLPPPATLTQAPTELPTATQTESAPTSLPSATAVQVVDTPTPQAPTAVPGGTPSFTPAGSDDQYLDDRSTPDELIRSYFNAIHRKEYVRAYSYWLPGAPKLQPYQQFAEGYAQTDTVDVTIGTVGGDAGAGQIYYIVPVVIKAQTTSGANQLFSGCYTLHLARPEIQAEPPFIPMNIESASVNQAARGANEADLLAHACEGPDIRPSSPLPPTPVPNPEDISTNNYQDNRSGPVEVLRSLFNAINRKEYARAYSYWENTGANPQVPPFEQFTKGYADTESVELTTGAVSGDSGAGQRYYTVPVVLKAHTTGGGLQTFAGCYILHLANPLIQGEPPFLPMGIQSADVQLVANDADPIELLSRPCGP